LHKKQEGRLFAKKKQNDGGGGSPDAAARSGRCEQQEKKELTGSSRYCVPNGFCWCCGCARSLDPKKLGGDDGRLLAIIVVGATARNRPWSWWSAGLPLLPPPV
jgi:hypothetical protein